MTLQNPLQNQRLRLSKRCQGTPFVGMFGNLNLIYGEEMLPTIGDVAPKLQALLFLKHETLQGV